MSVKLDPWLTTLVNSRREVAWFSMPKCGTQALEHSALFQEEMIRIYTPMPIWEKKFEEGDALNYLKVVLIRDPVSRLASCYANKRFHHIKNAAGGTVFESFDDFIDWLDEDTIALDQHWRPQVDMLPDLDKIDIISAFPNIEDTYRRVCELTKLDYVTLPKKNVSSKNDKPVITTDQESRINGIYKEDFELYAKLLCLD